MTAGKERKIEILSRFPRLDQLQFCLGVKGIRAHFLCCTKEKSQQFHPDAHTHGLGRKKTAALLLGLSQKKGKGRKSLCGRTGKEGEEDVSYEKADTD